jgi:hypothetical protein
MLLVVNAGLGCREKPESIVSDFSDSFDREELGSDWRDSGGHYAIVNGEVAARNVRHHPLWLRKKLQHDLSLEFDVRTTSSEGDIRVVIFGDGKSANPDSVACQSTGYELVLGGGKNKRSELCRGDEQGGGHRRVRTDWPITPGMVYHFYITRRGGLLSWYIGGHDMMAWDDPNPLAGAGHDYFGFDGGESEVFFDNLVIAPYHP